MKEIWIDWENEKIKAQYLRTREKVWLHVKGETFVYEPEATGRRRKNTTQRECNDNEIRAPMPGKITKLAGQIGDPVEPGQILVVMEAMKMEYTLKSGVKGEIRALSCKLGDQVTLGQLLVEIT